MFDSNHYQASLRNSLALTDHDAYPMQHPGPLLMSQSFMELDTCDQEYTEKIVDCFQPNFSVYTSLGANRETLKKTVSPFRLPEQMLRLNNEPMEEEKMP